MSFPETQDIYILSGHPSVNGRCMTLYVTPDQKLKALAGSYFMGYDPEFGEAEKAIELLEGFHRQLAEQDTVAVDTVGAQWVQRKSGELVTVLPQGDLEALIAETINARYKCKLDLEGGNEDAPEAELALGMGIDFMHWLNQQLSAQHQAEEAQKMVQEKLAEEASKFPNVNPEAKYFVGSDSEYPEQIFFDAKSAFESEFEYIDVFGKDGKVLERYKYVTEGELKDTPLENFEGYTTKF